MNENLAITHTEGPSWNIVGRFPTFELADKKRNELVADSDLQVKIHYQGTVNNRFYAVKIRFNPALAEAEAERLRKEVKKKRKAKLNKKRRKK